MSLRDSLSRVLAQDGGKEERIREGPDGPLLYCFIDSQIEAETNYP
jgi:hypothetical protein